MSSELGYQLEDIWLHGGAALLRATVEKGVLLKRLEEAEALLLKLQPPMPVAATDPPTPLPVARPWDSQPKEA